MRVPENQRFILGLVQALHAPQVHGGVLWLRLLVIINDPCEFVDEHLSIHGPAIVLRHAGHAVKIRIRESSGPGIAVSERPVTQRAHIHYYYGIRSPKP